jgi:hypothetical protein
MSDDLLRLLITRAAVVLLVVLLGLLFLSGCGSGSADFGLQKNVKSLQSFAAEGHLVAAAAQAGDATDPYVAVHAQELGQSAGQLATSMASSPVPPGQRAAVRELSRLAARTAAALGRLAAAPADRVLAGRVAARLDAIATRAASLQSRL